MKLSEEVKAAVRRFVDDTLDRDEPIVCAVTASAKGIGFCFGTDDKETIDRLIVRMRKALDQEPTSITTHNNEPPKVN